MPHTEGAETKCLSLQGTGRKKTSVTKLESQLKQHRKIYTNICLQYIMYIYTSALKSPSTQGLPLQKCSQTKCHHHCAQCKHEMLTVLLLEETHTRPAHFLHSVHESQKHNHSNVLVSLFSCQQTGRRYSVNTCPLDTVSQSSSNNMTSPQCSQMQAARWLMGNCSTINKNSLHRIAVC